MRRRALAAFLPFLVVICGLAVPWQASASFINYSSREINCKIVYLGPGAGLSDNLQYVYGKTTPEAKGKLIKLATETEDVLFFDFLPLSLGEIRGFKTRFHLYTVPNGDPGYEASRRLILKGVDGIVFVASADPADARANVVTLMQLRTHLAELGYDFDRVPLVFQVVGTGRKGARKSSEVRQSLLVGARQAFDADPVAGNGVFDTLKAIAKLVLLELKKQGPDLGANGSVVPPVEVVSPAATPDSPY